jgi:hypothetical protein
MTKSLPHAIASSTFTIWGVKLRCHVLDNGQRVIDARDARRFFEEMQGRGNPDNDDAEVQALTDWLVGKTTP